MRMRRWEWAGRIGVWAFVCLVGCRASAVDIWSVDFTGLPIQGRGAYGVDGGPPVFDLSGVTSWALDVPEGGLPASGCYVAVSNGCLEACKTVEPVVWRSQSIQMADWASVRVDVEVREVGGMESSDWIELRICTDGVTSVAARVSGSFGATTLSAEELVGEELEVMVVCRNSARTERHRIDGVRVSGLPGPAPGPPSGIVVRPARHALCVASGLALAFQVEGNTDEGVPVALAVTGLPPGAQFPLSQGTGTVSSVFNWTPTLPGRRLVVFSALSSTGIERWELMLCIHACDAVWINEFHYENEGDDVGEGVELAGRLGLALGGLVLDACNGSNGSVVDTQRVVLSGALGGPDSRIGFHWQPMPALQNGPDGIALWGGRCASTCVWDVVGYEGRFVIMEGPAAGVVAEPCGVAQSPLTPVGHSLQRSGAGWGAGGFNWIAGAASTPGELNAGQRVRSQGSVFVVH